MLNGEQKSEGTGYGQLMIALGIGLALRLIYFIGVAGHDDVSYFNYALDVLDGTFSTEPAADGSFPFRFRLGVILPTALLFRLLGPSEQVAAILPLAGSLALIWMCWWGGRRISPRAGFFAALLMATFPLAVTTATSLLPSPFTALLAGVSILYWTDTESGQRCAQFTARQANVRYFLAGVILGLAYFFRIEAGLFVMFFVAFAVVHRRAWLACGLALAGAASVVLIENIVYFLMHGELLYRLKVISGGFSDLDVELADVVQAKKSPLVYIKYIFFKPTDLGLHWAALLPCAVWGLMNRRPERTTVILWFWPVTLYLFFGSWSLSSYVPTTKDPRYLMIVTAPGLILVGAFADQLLQRSHRLAMAGRCALGGVLLAGLLLTNLVFVYRSENATGSRTAARFILRQEQSADAVSAIRTGPIWCEHHGALALRCLLPHRDIVPLTEHDLGVGQTAVRLRSGDLTADGIVVMDAFLINKYVSYSDMLVPEYLLTPPDDWNVLYRQPHPTDGPAYAVVRAIDTILGGRMAGPAQSLQEDPVSIYHPIATH